MRGLMTKVDDITAEMLRLAFFHGARSALRVLAEKNAVRTVLLSGELRDFDRETKLIHEQAVEHNP